MSRPFQCTRTHHGYDELLRDTEVDAVYTPMPNALHREWAIKAAEDGGHVLCGQPIALNAAESRKLIAANQAHRVLQMEAFMYHYADYTRQVLEVLCSGVLGEINFISSKHRFLLINPASIKLPELPEVRPTPTGKRRYRFSPIWYAMKPTRSRTS